MPPELLTDIPRCALAVYAHPDDSDVAAGGTLAYWAALGCEVHVLICALGDKGSSDPTTDPAALVAMRTTELEGAAKLLGVSGLHRLSYPDGEVDNTVELRRELVAIMRAVRPNVLICPDPLAVFFGEHYFNHHDHREIGIAALDAAAPAAASPLYFPETGKATAIEVAYMSGSLEPNIFVDITETIDRKVEAIMCHESQLGETSEWFRTVVHERAEQAGRVVGVRYAEAFRRIGLGH